MKKRNIIITAAIILTHVLVLSLAACSPKQSETEETEVPTETAEVTDATEATDPVIEPTEAATEAATEPEETEPEATQPVTTSKPSTGTSTDTNTGNSGNSSGTTTVVPPVTEPASVETPNVTPAPTPTPTEPATTEPKPTEHIHNWQEVKHEEVSHNAVWYVCQCGAYFNSLAEWDNHSAGFDSEHILEHSGWGTIAETVVDTPAYSTWVCTCGATSDTQP